MIKVSIIFYLSIKRNLPKCIRSNLSMATKHWLRQLHHQTIIFLQQNYIPTILVKKINFYSNIFWRLILEYQLIVGHEHDVILVPTPAPRASFRKLIHYVVHAFKQQPMPRNSFQTKIIFACRHASLNIEMV